jgi:hypothetical protein
MEHGIFDCLTTCTNFLRVCDCPTGETKGKGKGKGAPEVPAKGKGKGGEAMSMSMASKGKGKGKGGEKLVVEDTSAPSDVPSLVPSE